VCERGERELERRESKKKDIKRTRNQTIMKKEGWNSLDCERSEAGGLSFSSGV
jgi:hypothetical protein